MAAGARARGADAAACIVVPVALTAVPEGIAVKSQIDAVKVGALGVGEAGLMDRIAVEPVALDAAAVDPAGRAREDE